MYNRESIISAYQRLGSIPAVCLETGCQPYIAYKWLKIAKVLKSKEGMRYGTTGQKQGARAELEFKRLVPFAMPANEALQNNCIAFDFDINGITVDVKFASLCEGSGVYTFRTAHSKPIRPDYSCAFLAAPGLKELKSDQYRVLVVPDELVTNIKGVHIQKNSVRYWDFEIAPNELAGFFREYLPANEYLNQGVA